MDNPNEVLTTATIISALGGIGVIVIRQLALAFIKRVKDRWDTDTKEEKSKAEVEAAEDKLSIEAKSFLTEAAKDHLEAIRNMAQDCQDEVKTLRKEILESKIERASLQAKDEVRLEEIQRIRNDYIEARSNLNETKQNLESAQGLVVKLQNEMSGLRQEMDKMNNQISVFESRLMSEQQNTRIIEQRLESAEAQLKVKDELLKDSKRRNDKLSQDVRDLQRKLREYAAKLHVVENNMEANNDALDTKELIARDYDDYAVTTLVNRIEDVKSSIEASKPPVEVIDTASLKEDKVKEETKLLETINSVGEVSDVPKEFKKPITKKIIPPAEEKPKDETDKKE